MHRRRFIQVAASAGAVGVLAGCTQDQGGSDSDETDDGTDEGRTSEESTTTEAETTATAEGSQATTTAERSGGDRTRTGTRDGVDYSISITGSRCGNGAEDNEVDDIAFDEEAVEIVVTGTIDAATPCEVVDASAIDHDESGGHVTVTVATVEPANDPDVCQQCLGALDYEATLAFDGSIPSEASVVHDGQSGRRELSSAGYGSESATAPPQSSTTTGG